MSITVYSKPACVQCKATQHYLDKAGLRYSVVDLTQDVEAAEMVEGLGYKQAPVVVVGDNHWSGFSPDRIRGLADTPGLL